MSSKKKKGVKAQSSVFTLFPQEQIEEYKESFIALDQDKDGIISPQDLKKTCDAVGRHITDNEVISMIEEVKGPMNFTAFLSMIAEKVFRKGDDKTRIINSVEAFEERGNPGKIDADKLREELTMNGEEDDKLTSAEVDAAFEVLKLDKNGKIDSHKLIALLAGDAL